MSLNATFFVQPSNFRKRRRNRCSYCFRRGIYFRCSLLCSRDSFLSRCVDSVPILPYRSRLRLPSSVSRTLLCSRYEIIIIIIINIQIRAMVDSLIDLSVITSTPLSAIMTSWRTRMLFRFSIFFLVPTAGFSNSELGSHTRCPRPLTEYNDPIDDGYREGYSPLRSSQADSLGVSLTCEARRFAGSLAGR